MKINIERVGDIMSDKLTMAQRGILITIFYYSKKVGKPSLLLAMCKDSISFIKSKDDLITLCDKGFIEWSGLKKAKESLEIKELESEVIEIVDFMNNLYKRKFAASNAGTRTNLVNRLKDYTIDEIKKVIANRYVVWKDEPKMVSNLRPSTIFRASNFIKYLDEVKHTREGESFVNASYMDLEDGTPITMSIAKNLIATDTYNLRMYNTDGDGNKRGNGKDVTRYGKDIKKLINVQDVQEQHNGVREYLYFYNANK